MNSDISTHFQEVSGGTVTINAQGIFHTYFAEEQRSPLVANSTDGIVIDYWNNQKGCNTPFFYAGKGNATN